MTEFFFANGLLETSERKKLHQHKRIHKFLCLLICSNPKLRYVRTAEVAQKYVLIMGQGKLVAFHWIWNSLNIISCSNQWSFIRNIPILILRISSNFGDLWLKKRDILKKICFIHVIAFLKTSWFDATFFHQKFDFKVFYLNV